MLEKTENTFNNIKDPVIDMNNDKESNNQAKTVVNENISSVVENKSRINIINIFIFIIFLLAIASVIFFISQYYQTYNFKKTNKAKEINQVTDSISADNQSDIKYQLVNGNLEKVDANGNLQILLDKNNISEIGISGFSRMSISPDNKYICLESLPPSLKPALYIYDINSSDIKLLSENKQDCAWSNNSKFIVYKDLKTTEKNTNLYVYNFDDLKERNITMDLNSDDENIISLYNFISWSKDDSKIYFSQMEPQSNIVLKKCNISFLTDQKPMCNEI